MVERGCTRCALSLILQWVFVTPTLYRVIFINFKYPFFFYFYFPYPILGFFFFLTSDNSLYNYLLLYHMLPFTYYQPWQLPWSCTRKCYSMYFPVHYLSSGGILCFNLYYLRWLRRLSFCPIMVGTFLTIPCTRLASASAFSHYSSPFPVSLSLFLVHYLVIHLMMIHMYYIASVITKNSNCSPLHWIVCYSAFRVLHSHLLYFHHTLLYRFSPCSRPSCKVNVSGLVSIRFVIIQK